MTTLPPASPLLPSPFPPIDADSLVALNNALRSIPAEELRAKIRSVCLSNLKVAAVLHNALCRGREGGKGSAAGGVSGEIRGLEGEDGEEDQPINNDVVPKAAVIDLTDPDSDKENILTAPKAGQKRKAGVLANDDDLTTEPLIKKRTAQTHATIMRTPGKEPKKRGVATTTAGNAAANSTVSGELHFKDRYKRCSNCGELFDLMATPCHGHKNGPKRTPGPRERLGGDNYEGDDDSEDDENDEHSEDEDVCDCIHHPGYMWADDSQFIDHDEDCHGALDADWTKQEYPEKYIWDCCDQAGTADGCKMGKHEASPYRSELARFNAAGGLQRSDR